MENQSNSSAESQRDSNPDTDARSKYDPTPDDKLHNETPVTSSPGETPYTGSHADNYDPEQTPDRNVDNDGPSGENTKNGGERGGGLWTSGGQVTTGTPYHDEDEQ